MYKYAEKHLTCTPPFCDGMPKGNQNPSSKGGGDEELRNRAKSARKPRISSRTSTTIHLIEFKRDYHLKSYII